MEPLSSRQQVGKASNLLEWQVCDHDGEWHSLPEVTSATNGSPLGFVSWLRWIRKQWRLGAVLLVLLLAGGGWAWVLALKGLEQIELELRDTVAAEQWMRAPSGQTGRQARSNAQAPALPPASRVEVLTLQAETAVVRITWEEGKGQPVKRQTQAYQHTQSGWERVALTPALMGASHRLETDYFVFDYRQLDAHAVTGVAATLDERYRTIARQVGISLPEFAKKLKVEVSPSHAPGDLSIPASNDDPYIVASPALYVAPVELSDEELLGQSLELVMLKEAHLGAANQYGIPAHWQPVLDGLLLWQLWQADVPLAAWREETITWLFVIAPAATDRAVSALPEHYEEMCAMYRLWLASPNRIQVPLRCNELDQREWRPVWQQVVNPPAHLVELAGPMAQTGHTYSIHRYYLRKMHPSIAVALATVVEYAVASYGEERIPQLVASLRHHTSWETLAPAVFGVPFPEFEAGWHEFMADRYHVTLDRQESATHP